VPALSPLTLFAIVSASLAAVILVAFLVLRPPLDRTAKLWLLLGLGVFPIGAAAATNVQGYQATQQRKFCGSCHVMTPYARDVESTASLGLAARHGRNPYFGKENCYVCHADYGMYGTVLTKLGGMRHVWLYYTEFSSMPLDESKEKIHLVRPYPNDNCMQCHSTSLQGWLADPDHKASLAEVRAGRMSCASPGCHGYAHPWSKPPSAKVPAQLAPSDAGAADPGAVNVGGDR
jgi:cytochrome c-type protein NapC